MTDGSRSAFLAGERPDDVLLYLAASAVSDVEALVEYGERVENGVVLLLDAERGRRVAKRALGTDPMDLASAAMDRNGRIDLVRFRGDCPAADSSGTNADDSERAHTLGEIFAFAEEQNEEVGGIYAEGDVIHAYAVCSCGTAYSDRWVTGSRDGSK